MISKIALAPPPPRPTGALRPANPALSASAAAVASARPRRSKPPSKGAIIGGDGRGLYKALGHRVVSLAAL
jgi:hypothetical protein